MQLSRLFFIFSISAIIVLGYSYGFDETEQLIQSRNEMESKTVSFLTSQPKTSLLLKSHIFDNSPKTQGNVSLDCYNALVDTFSGNMSNWWQMIIYSGREAGDYGNYLECQDLSNAHFCTIRYIVNNISNVALSTGICVPSICESSDIVWALNKIPRPSWMPSGIIVTAECVPKQAPHLRSGGIVTVVIIFILIGLVIVATVIDLIKQLVENPDDPLPSPYVKSFEIQDEPDIPTFKRGDKISTQLPSIQDDPEAPLLEYEGTTDESEKPLLTKPTKPAHEDHPLPFWLSAILCFSLSANLKKLVNHYPDNKTNLNPLNSLRVLGMLWVILGHTCLFTIFIGYTNAFHALKHLIPSVSFEVILNGTLSVDIFFYLSGFLTTYFTLKELRQRNGRMNWVLVLLHRLWRLTPTMVLALFFCWQVAPHLGNGPWWRTFMTWTTEACKKYWWTNILYINNFWNFDLEQTCLAWSWYMSTDLQFYFLCLPLCYLLYKSPKWGAFLIGLIGTASLSYVAGISAAKDLSPQILHMDAGYHKYLYTKPWARVSTMLIGMGFAHMLLDHEADGTIPHGFRKLPQVRQGLIVTLAWIGSIALTLAPIFGTYSLYQWDTPDWNKAQKVLFLTFSRPAFTLGVAGMAHLVMTSRASVSLKHALSHPIWTPFARLTFGAYLYHPIVMFCYYFSSSRPVEFTSWMIVIHWLAFSMLSFLASLISFLIVERPTESFESLVLKYMKEKKQKRERKSTD